MDAATAHQEATSFSTAPGQAITYQIGKLQITKLLAEARMMESAYYYFRGELHEGARAAGDAKRLATKLGDPDGRASSLETLGLLYLDLGELTRADAVGREALKLAEEQGNERRQWVAWTVIGIAAYLKGDLTGARFGFEGLGAAAKQSRSSAGQALADIGLAHMAFLGGKLEASLEVLKKSVFRQALAPVRSIAWAMQAWRAQRGARRMPARGGPRGRVARTRPRRGCAAAQPDRAGR